jgi:hypothetical protein
MAVQITEEKEKKPTPNRRGRYPPAIDPITIPVITTDFPDIKFIKMLIFYSREITKAVMNPSMVSAAIENPPSS